jgi:hypothetical protein
MGERQNWSSAESLNLIKENITAAMKRLFPILVLAAFLLGILSGGMGRGYATLKISTSPPSSPNLLVFIPCDDASGNWDAANQPVSLPANLVDTPKPSYHDFLLERCPGQTSPKHYAWQGLGCGGLPA